MEKPSVLKELYIGIGLAAIFFLILGIIVMRPFWIFALGLLAGCVGAGIWLYGMYDVLNRALDLDREGAKKFVTIRSILRLVLIMAFMGIALVIHWNAFVGVAIGLLSLKISALMNPFVKKYVTKTVEISKAVSDPAMAFDYRSEDDDTDKKILHDETWDEETKDR